MTPMKTLATLALCALGLTACISGPASAETEIGDGNCNDTNYGINANTYIFANRDCSWYEDNDTNYYQMCDSHTKTGFAAGSGAGHNSDPKSSAQMEMTAGTQCTNGNSTL